MKRFSFNRILICLSFLILFANSVVAAEKALTGQEIEKLLPNIVAVGENTRQTFSKAGATTYTNNGRDSYGSWRVQGDKYCSQWPPSRDWDCFALHANDDQSIIIWIESGGHRTKNTVLPKSAAIE